MHLRQEKRAALEEALDEHNPEESAGSPDEAEDALWPLLSLGSNDLREADGDMCKQIWLGLHEEVQQKLCQAALRSVLHPDIGPVFIQGQLLIHTK